MMVLHLFLTMAAVAGPTPTPATEMLGVDAPDQFQVINHQRNDQSEIIELARPPDNINKWSSLITSLMFFDAARDGLATSYDHWVGKLRSDCPGLIDRTLQGTVDGHPAIRSVLSCPSNPKTGKPENLSAFLVQGDANLMMAQVAFRHTITSLDAALIEHIGGSLKVCDQRTFNTCSARKATGFLTISR